MPKGKTTASEEEQEQEVALDESASPAPTMAEDLGGDWTDIDELAAERAWAQVTGRGRDEQDEQDDEG